MTQFRYLVLSESDALIRILNSAHSLTEKVDAIMVTQAEIAASLQDVQAQVAKIGTETAALLEKVSDLENALPDDVTPELQAAVDALKAQVQVVDDLVEDAPTPP